MDCNAGTPMILRGGGGGGAFVTKFLPFKGGRLLENGHSLDFLDLLWNLFVEPCAHDTYCDNKGPFTRCD